MQTRLWEIMKRKGIKQKDLEAQTRISHAAMSALCNGKSEPTLKSARAIAKVLEMTIDDLWPEEEE